MNAKRAKEILSPIPEERWCTGFFRSGINKRCAIGHLSEHVTGHPSRVSYTPGLHTFCYETTHEAFKDLHNVSTIFDAFQTEQLSLASVNNHRDIKQYPQPTPKQRVLAFLDDMIAWEESKEGVKELMNAELETA